jgi:hypothetical protein
MTHHSSLNSQWLILALSLAFLGGCSPTLECGTWTFSGAPSGDSFPLTSSFLFTPATCGKNCRADIDAMIQMTWVYDATDKTYLVASGQPAARQTANGWMIDRVGGEGEGWYGLQNDGKTFVTGWNTTGSNGQPDILYDTPGGWPPNTWFFAVDVAVCFKSDSCQNRILGYYVWSWYIDNSSNGTSFITAPAWQGLDTEFQSAVAAWNAWAPTSGTQSYPGDPTTLPNAALLPTMTDL